MHLKSESIYKYNHNFNEQNRTGNFPVKLNKEEIAFQFKSDLATKTFIFHNINYYLLIQLKLF